MVTKHSEIDSIRAIRLFNTLKAAPCKGILSLYFYTASINLVILSIEICMYLGILA